MKVIHGLGLAAALSGICGAAGASQWPAVQVHADAAEALVISCARPALPSQKQVGRVLHVSNFGQTYELRSKVMVVAAQACKAGAARVLVQASGRGQLTWVATR